MKSFIFKELLPVIMLGFSTTVSAVPTVYLAGDSTMAPGGDGAGTGTEGWGQFLRYSFGANAVVVNDAIAGRSARSFTVEGHFNTIATNVKAGDWVIIEFGHNDGGSPIPESQDNGRADCPGQGDQTCVVVINGTTEVIQTYPTYLMEASQMFLAKGAKVVLSSPTPDNPWETGTFTYAPNRFTYFSWLSASELGGTAEGVYFVDHGQYTANMMQDLGATVINANYPIDHTHTSPLLANFVAEAFVLGLKCGTSGLEDLVINATARLEGPTLGTCILANATLPI
jgi:rhamnogalacturonan acetylesterase